MISLRILAQKCHYIPLIESLRLAGIHRGEAAKGSESGTGHFMHDNIDTLGGFGMFACRSKSENIQPSVEIEALHRMLHEAGTIHGRIRPKCIFQKSLQIQKVHLDLVLSEAENGIHHTDD